MATDIALAKKPHQKMSLTTAEIIEFTRCAHPITGPMYFMSNYFYIQHPTRGKMRYKPFDYQERLIETYHNYRFSISLLPRQTGKSTSAAGYLLWYAMFVPDSTILIAAHKYSGAHEIMLRIRYAYETCPDFIRAGVVSYNKGSIEFENGSRIVAQATTENTGRGMSITLLYSDEFAFVRPTIAKEFWTSISPTLSTGGKAIITSTPNSDEDQFALLWKGANKTIDAYGNETDLGANGFKAFRAEWWEHPDRDDKWAEEEKLRIGEERFRREHGLEFLIDTETLIDSSTLALLESTEPREKIGHVRWFQKPEKGKIYLVGLDPSLGTGNDPAAIQIFEANTTTQIGEWTHNKTPIQDQVKIMVDILKYIYECTGNTTELYYSVENNSIGEAALVSIQEYGEENIPGNFLSEYKAPKGKITRLRRGFYTSHTAKVTACAKLKALIETKKMKIYSKGLISELKTFVAKGNSYAAIPGENDDLVMATVLIVRMLQTIKDYYQELGSQMKDHADEIKPLPIYIVF